MSRYLITGIAGFIGSTLATRWSSRNTTCAASTTSPPAASTPCRRARQDQLPADDLQDVAGCAAARASTSSCTRQRSQACRVPSKTPHLAPVNINGTLNLLLAARDAKVRRIVYAAPLAYGDQPTQPKQEDMSPLPLSPMPCRARLRVLRPGLLPLLRPGRNLPAILQHLRPAPAADSPYSGVIAKFTTMMMAGQTPTIFGDGLTSRDFNFVDNAVSANLLACLAPSSVATGRVFNIGTGRATHSTRSTARSQHSWASPLRRSTAPHAR